MASEERQYKVDVEKIISDYTWKRFRESKPLLRRPFCWRKNYTIDVNWAYIDFTHKTPKFEILPDTVGSLPSDIKTGSAQQTASPQPGPGPIPDSDKDGNKNVVLYRSKYENRTGLDQQYTFSTTRETKSSCTVQLEESYTKGAEANIEISVPGDFITLGAGLSGELAVTKTKSETFEETLTWSVDTQINVEKGHEAEATVYVSERNSKAYFEVETTMSILDDKNMRVVVRRNSDDRVVFTDLVTDLGFIFEPIAKKSDSVSLEEYQDPVTEMLRSKVIFLSRGTCQSVSWKKQNVKVDAKVIPGENTESTDGSMTAEDGNLSQPTN